MSETETRPRSDRIDALKFISIALVVFGHVVDLPTYGGRLVPVLYVIRAVNMPLFMFLAGYVLFGREGMSPVSFIRRKALALIVPYFAWIGFELIRKGSPVAGWPSALLGAAVNPHAQGRKWFLYVLFVFYVLFTLVRVADRRDAWLLSAAAVTIAITFLPEGDYFGRFNVEWLFAFFVVGYLASKHRSRLPRRTPLMAVSAVAAFVALLLVGWRPEGGAGWPPWFFGHVPGIFLRSQWSALAVFLLWKYAAAFAGIAAAVSLYSLIDVRRLRAQAVVGRRSLGIYVTQGPLLVLAGGTGLIDAAASSALVLVVSLGVAMLLERSSVTRVLFLGMRAHQKLPSRPTEADIAA